MKRTIHRKRVIITNDPSFTAWGICVISVPEEEVIECLIIKTEPQGKKKRIRVGDDRVRRIGEIRNALMKLSKKYSIQLILTELPHGSQSAVVAIMIGAVTAILDDFAGWNNIPIEWYSEGDAKKAILAESHFGSKNDIIKAVQKNYEVPFTGIQYKDEAIADAMAIYAAAKQQSSIIKFLLK